MRMMTIQGNRSTAPNGIDIFELPFSRIRLLKKDSLGVNRSFSLLRSDKEGNVAFERSRFVRPSMRPILEHVFRTESGRGLDGTWSTAGDVCYDSSIPDESDRRGLGAHFQGLSMYMKPIM